MFASLRGEIECEAAAASRRSHYAAIAAAEPAVDYFDIIEVLVRCL